MRRYDYSFIKSVVPGNIVGTAGIIADLRTREGFRREQYPEAFEALRKKAMIASVRDSNAIEGVVSTEDRIIDIVVNGEPPITHDEKEISGYRDALELIHTRHGDLDVDEELILRLHYMIMHETEYEQAGHYKKSNNLIMEYGSDGSRHVKFRPVGASETRSNIEQMLLAYYDARQDSEIPSILLIPCVILDFLCIHPFRDGNGRISRLLSIMMLYLSGHDICGYISFEGQINKYKEAYYDKLQQSSLNWHDNSNDYMPFAINFIQIIYRCYKELDESFMVDSLKKAKKSERVEMILMNAIVPISKAEIEEKLPDVSTRTIETVLQRLVKTGAITKLGTYRDARYMRKKH